MPWTRNGDAKPSEATRKLWEETWGAGERPETEKAGSVATRQCSPRGRAPSRNQRDRKRMLKTVVHEDGIFSA